MKSIVEILKECYQAAPSLKANFKEFSPILEEVNNRLMSEGRDPVSADELREAFREINPLTRFEPQFRLGDRIFEAVRTLFTVELPPLSPEEIEDAREQVIDILERRLTPADGDYYALATLGEALRTEGFDTRDFGGRGVKQLLTELFPEDTENALYDPEHSPHHYICLPSLHPYGTPQVTARERNRHVMVDRSNLDIVDLRRRFEFILSSTVPAPDGWYELVKITPALKSKGFDFHAMGFYKLKDLLSALYGEALEIEDRGDAEHPNKKFLRLPDDHMLHSLPSEISWQTQPRTFERPEPAPRVRFGFNGEERPRTALDKLLDFAFFPARAGQNGLDLALSHLARTARPERWYYGRRDPGNYPLLKNFLTITFERLQYEDSVGADDPRYEPKILAEGGFATFNTGLCDHYNEPIYALFKQNERVTDSRPWTFVAFVDSRTMGQYDMTGKFGAKLPESAHYYDSTAQLSFDVRCDIAVTNLDHFIDHCQRLPIDFLRYFGPQNFDYDRYRNREFYEDLAEAIKSDPDALSRMRTQFESAIDNAKTLLRWNYRRAVPIYYPKEKTISLLLPLMLGNSSYPNVALVLTKTPSGDYVATTIYTLGMAYAGARLLCVPEKDWLRLNEIG
ncbi:MAG: DUF3825 domain-containing protein [Muribaculaceae bacterium]|nr:DUF3825 domain-containing protein [Muribaculaceae bacterium]